LPLPCLLVDQLQLIILLFITRALLLLSPCAGDKLQLQGLCAFDAAVHCASMTSSTSARHAQAKQQQRGATVQRLVQHFLSRFLMLPSGADLQSV
jgi:hypothetical protein